MAEARPLGETPLLGVAVDDIRFLQPVPVGSLLTVVARVLDKRDSSKPHRGFVRVQLMINEVTSGEAVASKIWTILVPRRPRSPD